MVDPPDVTAGSRFEVVDHADASYGAGRITTPD
jgi:hypothetical protein